MDPPFTPNDRLELTGYRLASKGRYRRIEPDSQGRLHSETTGLSFVPSEDGRTVRIVDGPDEVHLNQLGRLELGKY